MSGIAEQVLGLSATRLARLIRDRALSPTELVDATLDRIEEHDPALNAFVLVDSAHARAAARVAEAAVLAGRELGPLHGVPTALKDLGVSRPGWVDTFGGIPALRGLVSDRTGLWAARMEAAGAIVVGKTNSPVLGFRGVCDNELFGPTSNPFDLSRNAGGSSGGAAAAVAGGLVPLAQGTDAGGSIRIPAAWTNLVGHKPSAGRVPMVMRPDAFVATAPFVHDGALTRTVEDAVTAVDVLSGPDGRDPFSSPGRPDLTGVLDGDVRGLRIAVSPELGVHQVEPGIVDAVARTVDVLRAAGARVDRADPAIPYDQAELSDLWCRCTARMTASMIRGFGAIGVDLAPDQLPGPLRYWLDQVAAESPDAAARDAVMRTEVLDAFEGVLADHDVVVSATLGALPVPNGERGSTLGPTRINGTAVDPTIGWTLTYLVNFTGHPACSVPAGLVAGLPVGMQVIGRRFADADVLRVAAAVERLQPWAQAYPFRGE